MSRSGGGGAGGAAMGAGGSYQARIAAWLAAHALAEHDAEPPLQLTSPVEAIGCDGPDPVDDVVARTLKGHTAGLQAKRAVSVSGHRTAPDGRLTPFASAIDQFVRQYILRRDDKMAETVLVRVVERYLADFRSIFQDDERARRDLVEVLDTFVQARSEGARRLSYGLDGVFR